MRDLRIYRNEVIFAFELQAIAADIDKSYRIGASAGGFLHEIAKRVTQRILVEIASTHHIEARRLKRLRDQASVIRGGVERAANLIGGIADHEGDARFRVRRARRRDCAKWDQ